MTESTASYDSLMAELFRRHPSVQTAGFGSGAYKPGLEAMRSFDAALGHPWRAYPCIHVAGTNGKGSVCSMLAAALSVARGPVGLYTSPHLLDWRERLKLIRPDGTFTLPDKDWVVRFLTERAASLKGLSFFEITTGMAFRWFAEQQVDTAIIEVGLGGRLDSTNIITPELSVITGIGLDHCALLGDTRAKIAAEKAGIFKPGVPALVATRDAETEPVFRGIAAAAGAPLHFADEEGSADEAILARLDLQGPCQETNLRTVLCALRLLGEPPSPDAIASTAARTGFHARWERLLDHPEVIADIGHNPPALKENFARLEASGRPLFIVFGMMADKDLDGISPYMPSSASWYLAAPEGDRAMSAPLLQERLRGLHPDFTLRSFGSVAEAVGSALRDAACVSDALVYIGGSTFTVAEALRALNLGK